MQVSVETLDGLERKMTVHLADEKISQEVEKRLKSYSNEVKIDGFRPGKVPMRLVKQRYGGAIKQEVLGEVIKSSFMEAVQQEDLKLVAEPKIEPFGEGKEYGFNAVFEVYPEVSVNDLSQAKINIPIVEITDEDLSGMINTLQKQKTTWNEVDREAKEEDRLKIDFIGRMDGEAFEGGSGDGVPLVLGSKSMIEGFETGLLGAKPEEDRCLKLKFPEGYHAKDLAGKDVEFDVKVQLIEEPVLPEIDEAFVKEFGVESGLRDDLDTEIKSNMQRELEQAKKNYVKTQVIDGLYENNKIDVPKAFVGDEIQRLKKDALSKAPASFQQNNMSLPDDMFTEKAKKQIALGFIMSELMKMSELKVDSDRVKETIEKYSESYENPAEMVDWYYNDKERLAGIESFVLEEQIIDWVVEKSDSSEKSLSFDEIIDQARNNFS